MINWAERHAVLREKPLRPTDDLIAAAEAMISRLTGCTKGRDIDTDETSALIRGQAVLPVLGIWDTHLEEYHPENEDHWEMFKQDYRRLRIRWDVSKESYVATGDSRF